MDENVTYTESTDMLLTYVEDAGYPVSLYQLERWQGAGLLPRPHQKGLGRGYGTQTLYPPGTTKHLLALCRIAKKHRKANRRGWELWWQGFSIDEKYWRPILIEMAEMLDRRIGWFRDADGGISDEGLKTLEALAVGPMEWRGIRQIRKRVSIKYFLSFMTILARVAISDFDGVGLVGPDRQIDLDILRKAFGASEPYEDVLKAISANLPGNWRARITAMSDEEIFTWRDALRATLTHFCDEDSPGFDKKSIEIRTLNIFFLTTPKNLATLLIMLISLKNTMFRLRNFGPKN